MRLNKSNGQELILFRPQRSLSPAQYPPISRLPLSAKADFQAL